MADDSLEFLLELNADTSGATRMDGVLKTLDNTMNLLNFHLGHIEENTRKVNKQHADHEKQAKGLLGVLQRVVHQGLEPFLHKAKEIAEFEFIRRGVDKLIEFPGELAHEVKELGKEALKVAADEQRMSRVFASLSGGEQAGEANQEWLERFAKATEHSEERAEQTFIALKKVGMDDKSARLALKASADIAAVSANKDEAMDSAVGAFARLQRVGKINARMLAPLSLGVADFKKLDRFKGMDNKAIEKQMEEGHVSRDELIKLIMSKTHETKLGQRAADNSDLLGTKIEKLGELPDRYFKRLAKSDGMKTLTDSFEKLLTKLDPESATGKRISAFLDTLFTGAASIVSTIVDEVDKIDFESIGATITNDVVPALKTMTSWIKPIVEEIQKVLSGLHDVHDLFTGKGMFNKYNERNLYSGDTAAGINRIRGLAGKDNPNWMQAGADKGKALGAGVEAGAKDRLQIHSPSKVFADLGRMSAAGFLEGIDVGGIDQAVERMYPTPATATARRGAAAGGPGITVQLHFHIGAGAPAGSQEMAEQIATSIKEILPGALENALEKVSIGMGSA